MATYSKLGYGNAANIDTAITNGKIDGKDIVITKDTSEFYYIRDDKTKQAIRPRPAMYNSVSAAEIDLAKMRPTLCRTKQKAATRWKPCLAAAVLSGRSFNFLRNNDKEKYYG